MGRAFKRLERVLNLEAQQGYQNKAVVGGIRQFATFWLGQAREEANDEADRALVEQVAEVLMEYGRLPGMEARQKAIDSLSSGLAARRQRVGEPAPAAAKPKQPPRKPEPKRQQQRPSPLSRSWHLPRRRNV